MSTTEDALKAALKNQKAADAATQKAMEAVLKAKDKELRNLVLSYEKAKDDAFKKAAKWLKGNGFDLEEERRHWKSFTFVEASLKSGPIQIQEWNHYDHGPSYPGRVLEVPREAILS